VGLVVMDRVGVERAGTVDGVLDGTVRARGDLHGSVSRLRLTNLYDQTQMDALTERGGGKKY